jgi:hypothetical protein
MTRSQAVKIIDKLIVETKANDYKNKVWVTKVRSIVIEIFGKDSVEHGSIIHGSDAIYGSEEFYYNEVATNYAKLLPSFAETLLIKGIYKPPKGNMVSHLKNWQILGSIVAIYFAGFATYKVLDEMFQKKSVTPAPFNVPNKISNTDTNSQNNTKRYEKLGIDSPKVR